MKYGVHRDRSTNKADVIIKKHCLNLREFCTQATASLSHFFAAKFLRTEIMQKALKLTPQLTEVRTVEACQNEKMLCS